MQRRVRGTLLLTILLTLTLDLSTGATMVTLSGATFFQADSTGAFSPSDRWNTLATGDWGRAWFTSGLPLETPDGLTSPFINGPTVATAPLSIALSPGIYNFTVFLNDGTPIVYHGVNLYFDGHTMIPDISAYAQDQTSLSSIPPFFVNSANTLALEPYSFNGTLVPGSGTLVYTNGDLTVELISFVFTSQFLYNVDRVNSFTTSPDGQVEKVATFTLRVTQQTVPFAAFTAKLDLMVGPSARKDRFALSGTFTLGASSNGIAPLTEAVSLALAGGTGSVTLTIPVGSFTRTGNGGFAFEGTINGVALEARIRPIRGNQFTFEAEGTGANLTGIANSVTVTLTIGDDAGLIAINAELK